MPTFFDLLDKLKREFWFSKKEWFHLAIVTLALSFMLMFRNWGGANFNAGEGFANWTLGIIIVLVSILIHLSFQRVAAIHLGFKHEFVISVPLLAAGLLICLVTNGWAWWFVAMGGFTLHMLVQHRLGFFRYGLNYWSQAMIALWGIIGTILLGSVINMLLASYPGNFILQKALVFNMALAIVTALPIPPLDGSKILYAVRIVYVFVIGAVLGWAMLIYYTNALTALIGTVLIGGAAVAIVFFVFEDELK